MAHQQMYDFQMFCFAILITHLRYIFPLTLFRNILPKDIAEHSSGQEFLFNVLFKLPQIFDEVKKIPKYTYIFLANFGCAN